LHEINSTIVERKQAVEIPPVTAKYIEHVCHSRVCPFCGKTNAGSFPEHIKAPIQYGNSVAAIVSYLSVYQYLPYRRITILLKDLFGIQLSEGTIDNLLERTTQKAIPAYQLIQQKIKQSQVVGGDETGTSFGGKKGWFHTWQTSDLTFIVASLNRGYKTVVQYFSEGFPKSIYVSDCWAAQLKVPALQHQLCIAHLLRELNNFEDALSCKWSTSMKTLLMDATALKKQLTKKDYTITNNAVLQLEEKLDRLLIEQDKSNPHKKLQAFIQRLIKNRESIFTFLYHHHVPPDNNASERAIRNVKVKAKVSGQFRADRGATRFAILRSVIDTTIKNTQNIFEALTLILYSVPE
jgi:transposase